MKKVCLIICILAVITSLTGVAELAKGICERGFAGVNYGRVIFPVLIGIVSFVQYKKR